MAANTYVVLDTKTLATATPTVEFTGISQAYTDLVIVLNGVESANQYIGIRFNSDTAANYSQTRLFGDGTSATSDRQSSATFGRLSVGDPTNRFTVIASIFNYANATTQKTWLSRTNTTNNYVGSITGLWRATPAPITSIQITTTTADNFAIGSTFSLYGIKAEGVSPTPKATGGSIYSDSTYYYHTFGSTGTFTPLASLTADVLVVAGGGGSGGGNGGGGGAGGLTYYSSQSLTATGYSVTVGAGGAGGGSDARGSQGVNSQFGSLTASVGGGSGGGWNSVLGGNGGSAGGGSGQLSGPNAAGTPTSGQGNNGGTGGFYGSQALGGGGGGAGGAGTSASSGTPGNGGVGSSTYSSWGTATGTGQNVSSTYYYAGGGAGGQSSSPAGVGGLGGGGIGAVGSAAGNPGTVNTGGGAGGGGTGGAVGASGGSGIVVVRYLKA